MTKEEYIEKLTKYYEENKLQEADSYGEGYTDGLAEALDYATELSKELDEPKKVIIPQFVADWIEEYSKDFAPLGIVHQILNRSLEKGVQNHWRNDECNQKLLLNAIANGYEVEKEPELHVKLKGLVTGAAYLNYNVPFQTFSTNSLSSPEHMNTNFTKSWLAKNWSEYDAYNNAGLLEFEEVEDD